MLVTLSMLTTLTSTQPVIQAAIRPMARLGIQPRSVRPPAMMPEMIPAISPTTIQPTNVRSIAREYGMARKGERPESASCGSADVRARNVFCASFILLGG